jgi:hypothetical protein
MKSGGRKPGRPLTRMGVLAKEEGLPCALNPDAWVIDRDFDEMDIGQLEAKETALRIIHFAAAWKADT